MTFTDDFTHDEIKDIDLLTEPARELIIRYGGENCAKAANNMLQHFAISILARADLSFSALTGDVETLAHSKEISKDAPYSTLNPVDFIPMARKALEYAPAGIILNLPDDKKASMFAHLKIPQQAPEKPANSDKLG